jgi:hypothetical protein
LKTKQQTQKRTQADALIAKASEGQHMADPSATALAELGKVLEYNDEAPHKRRVSAAAAIEMMQSLGWKGSRQALDALCRRSFGRRTYGTP